MPAYLETKRLCVGYGENVLIREIDLQLARGKLLTLIGPNGAGKSTILKTIVRQLAPLGGAVCLDGRDLSSLSPKQLARRTAVVLTDRVRPALMTCAEVVAMGRYPHTNALGRLTAEDTAAVEEALELVHGTPLAQREFSTLSDGQRQRILLARALCQQPELLVLDEPTAYLDIRYKLELLETLRELSRRRGVTVLLSLHEVELAMKLSDLLLCVKGETIQAFGPPERVLANRAVERLYDLRGGYYDPLFGTLELSRPEGEPRVFVVAGGGYGIPCYRALQKRELPFATGILFDNDVDHRLALALSGHVVTAPAFEAVTDAQYEQAAALLLRCEAVIDAGTPIGSFNRPNGRLLQLARERNIPVYRAQAEQEV